MSEAWSLSPVIGSSLSWRLPSLLSWFAAPWAGLFRCLSWCVWAMWCCGDNGPAASSALPGLNLETRAFIEAFTHQKGCSVPISRISWTFVFVFILFGTFLVRSNCRAIYIVDVSRAAAVARWLVAPAASSWWWLRLNGLGVRFECSKHGIDRRDPVFPWCRQASLRVSRLVLKRRHRRGGQLILPPVMGAGRLCGVLHGSLMSTSLRFSFLPALIYFCLWHFCAYWSKTQWRAKVASGCEPLLKVLLSGWHNPQSISGVGDSVGEGLHADYAAGISILSVVSRHGSLKKSQNGTRRSSKRFLKAQNMATGSVVGEALASLSTLISTTGISNTFSLMM